MNYQHLIGREFKHGVQDCFTLVRDFYSDIYGIKLPNYARPDNWWDLGFDLYMKLYHHAGFRVIDVHPTQWKFGDGIIMAVRSTVGNHAGVIVENGNIIHHLYGRRSAVDPYRGIYRNATVAVVRHKDVLHNQIEQTLDLVKLLPDVTKRKLADLPVG